MSAERYDMNFYVMTLFPDMINNCMQESITGRAIDNNYISVNAINIRDYTLDKHKRVDDYPYGGGAGMLMQADPVVRTYEHIKELTGEERPRVLYMTPWGKTFTQQDAKDLAKEKNLVFLCGHYEGIDERALDMVATDFYSIGDYVLTGGELPALVMMDAISRMVPGVLSNEESGVTESFSDGLLEYPQYTRPEVYRDMAVPDVLLSGHHKNIEKWRHEQSIERTKKFRPDLLKDQENL